MLVLKNDEIIWHVLSIEIVSSVSSEVRLSELTQISEFLAKVLRLFE